MIYYQFLPERVTQEICHSIQEQLVILKKIIFTIALLILTKSRIYGCVSNITNLLGSSL